jgi:hypothetical protein
MPLAIGYPLIQYGSVYLTDDNLSSGNRYIAFVEGLDDLALTDNIGNIRAIDGTIYLQYQAKKDTEIKVRIPKMDWAKFDAVRDVIQTAVTGETTYTLNITVNGEAFTFTAKPRGITYDPSDVADAVEGVTITQYCVD